MVSPARTHRTPARLHPAVLGGLISLITVIGLVAAAEGLCAWLLRRSEPGIAEENTYHQIIDTRDPALGYRLIPGAQGRMTVTDHGRVVIDAIYTIDAAGRRVTPAPERAAAGTLLFFGDSFTFGEAVSDQETMPAAAARLLPDQRVYNYGVPGYGPQHTLVQLETGAIWKRLKPRRPIRGLHTFLNAHVRRARGTLRYYTTWMADCPHYVLDAQGALIRQGSFRTGWGWHARLYDVLRYSQVVRYLELDWPRRITKHDLLLTCRILEAARDRFRARFGSDEFYVLFYPGSSYAGRMVPWLHARGVRVLDYSGRKEWTSPRYKVPRDGHPTAEMHRIMAGELIRDLGLAEAPADGQGL